VVSGQFQVPGILLLRKQDPLCTEPRDQPRLFGIQKNLFALSEIEQQFLGLVGSLASTPTTIYWFITFGNKPNSHPLRNEEQLEFWGIHSVFQFRIVFYISNYLKRKEKL
jgi:hypothetical protein